MACELRSNDWEFRESSPFSKAEFCSLPEMKAIFRAMTHFHSNNRKILLQGIIEINLSAATLILFSLIPYLRKEHFEILQPEKQGFFSVFKDWEGFFADEIRQASATLYS